MLVGEDERGLAGPRRVEAAADLRLLLALAGGDFGDVGEIGGEKEVEPDGRGRERPVGHLDVLVVAAADKGVDVDFDPLGDDLPAARLGIARGRRLAARGRRQKVIADDRMRLDIGAGDGLDRFAARANIETGQKARLVEVIAIGVPLHQPLPVEDRDMAAVMGGGLFGIDREAVGEGEIHVAMPTTLRAEGSDRDGRSAGRRRRLVPPPDRIRIHCARSRSVRYGWNVQISRRSTDGIRA